MSFLGNILWLVLGGALVAGIYVIIGLLFCITIIGIPFGVQLLKLAGLALWPFGKDVKTKPGEPGCLSVVMNVLWILLGWWEIALVHLFFGILCCITIIGIPFGKQHFKLMLLGATPFGVTFQ
ncbi:MAG: YccF domain-containing protein [Bacteroidales bacterium]|nr:YccF domain-containing protein [Bacteroidales bacterium]MBQ9173297.1 YccF domain-containing protein [Bacteroidales bacterium]MBQ9713679.1 YccF domain-containing protein [Bacteroidales bacterium]